MRDLNYWKEWAVAALIRATKTFAQTAVSLISVCAILSEVDWLTVLSASTLSAICSLLMNIAGIPEVSEIKEVNSDGDGLE